MKKEHWTAVSKVAIQAGAVMLLPTSVTRFATTQLKLRVAKTEATRHRKVVESVAEKIHPTVGESIQILYNVSDSAGNLWDSLENGLFRDFFSNEITSLEIGDHLFAQRTGYTHHGIYVGEGQVVHYLRHCVSIDSIETFADGAKLHKKTEVESPLSYPKEEAAWRAQQRIGESNYHLLTRNCENFVRWCRNGLEDWV